MTVPPQNGLDEELRSKAESFSFVKIFVIECNNNKWTMWKRWEDEWLDLVGRIRIILNVHYCSPAVHGRSLIEAGTPGFEWYMKISLKCFHLRLGCCIIMIFSWMLLGCQRSEYINWNEGNLCMHSCIVYLRQYGCLLETGILFQNLVLVYC